MKIVGVIPSRFGSSRFPGKPLAQIAGKPLVAWVVEAAKKARTLDDVIVATDDARIAEAVERHGGKAVMTPSELPSGTDRIACAARNLLGCDFGDDDILVNIQGDEPLIDPALVVCRDEDLVKPLRLLDRLDDPCDEGPARENSEGLARETARPEAGRYYSIDFHAVIIPYMSVRRRTGSRRDRARPRASEC